MAEGSSSAVVAFEVEGAGAAVTVDESRLMEHVTELLPWGARRRTVAPGDRRFALRSSTGGYEVIDDGDVRYSSDSLGAALSVLADHLLLHVLLRAPDALFIHAGVVGYQGQAIVLPGEVGSGKSTLVAALVRAGADYYTDDYLPLDKHGRVHPYPIPLRLRNPDTGELVDHAPESLGGVAGVDHIPVGIIAHIPRREGGRLRLERRSAGEGILMLVSNSPGSDERPQFALTCARAALADARVFVGERGDADEAAAALLQLASEASRT